MTARQTVTTSDVLNIAARLERLPFTKFQLIIFCTIATAWFFDSVDLGALTFLLGPIKKEFGLTTVWAGALSSVSFLGMAIGAVFAGLAADRWGRRLVFQWSMLIWGAGSIFCGLTHTIEQLVIARFFVGLGMGMEFPVAQAIATEIIPAKIRGRAIAVLEGFWPLGFISAGLITYFVVSISGANWRTVFIIQGLPAAFLFVVRRVVPESPRWLMSKGRVNEAENVMHELERRVLARLKGKPLPAPEPLNADVSVQKYNMFDLWRKKYAKRTAMVWLLWFLALLGYYGLTSWLSVLLQQSGFPLAKSVLYTVWISCAGIPGFLMAAWLIEIIGRKLTCILTLLGAAASAYFYGQALLNIADIQSVILFGCAMQFCLFGMWSVLYAYTPELYPTRYRATGAGWASGVGRIGSLIGPPLVGLVLPTLGQSGVFALGAVAFVAAALTVAILGEETKGKVVEVISG